MVCRVRDRRQLGLFCRSFFFGGTFLGLVLGFFRALNGENFRRFGCDEYACLVEHGQGLQTNVPAGASAGIISVRFGFAIRRPEISGASSASLLFALSSAIAFWPPWAPRARAFEHLLLYAAQLHCAHRLHFCEKPSVAHGIVERRC